MKKILKRTLEELESGNPLVWVVILEAHGSTPRKTGARMAVFADGSTLDTVGGGVMELRATRHAGTLLGRDRADILEYDLDRDEGPNVVGMVCGGFVKLAFLPLNPGDGEKLALLENLSAALETLGDLWLETKIQGDGAYDLALRRDTDFHTEAPRLPKIPTVTKGEGTQTLLEPVSRDYMVWIFGGGHVCTALVPVLTTLSFPVTVYDPRPELLIPGKYPGAKLLSGSYGEISQRVKISSRDYVIIMTPGHEGDLVALRQVLATPAAYVGCIGSKKKTAFVRERLLEEGWTEADLARIHAPIGLPILAKTPEEIAVSIAAQLILHRAGGETQAG